MTAVATAPRTIVFAGGGSGGHLAPGLAIAEALPAAKGALRPHFFCSERAVDREMLARAGVDFTPIPAAPGAFTIRGLRTLRRSIRAARDRLRELRPACVISLGGFVSVPVVWSAWRLGIPVVLLNLDVVAGRANRLVSRLATVVLTAVPTRNLPRANDRIVGMPVRRAARAPGDANECRSRLGLDPRLDTLLVTGASQGSSSLNDAVPSLVAAMADAMRGWQVFHLAGAMDEAALARLRDRYRTADIPAQVLQFLHEMGTAWGAATLAITRAGASSVAEAAINQVPAIFVPFPHHRDQHQRLNALPMVRSGAALLARDPILAAGADPSLAEVLARVIRDRSFLGAAARSLRSGTQPDAALQVACVLRDLAESDAPKDR